MEDNPSEAGDQDDNGQEEISRRNNDPPHGRGRSRRWAQRGQGHQAPRSHGWKPRLPEFDGVTKWASFESRFKSIIDAMNPEPRECAAMLGQSLKGSAADYYSDLPIQVRRDYNALLKTLREMYATEDTPAQLQMELH